MNTGDHEFNYGLSSESHYGWDLNYKDNQDAIVEERLILIVWAQGTSGVGLKPTLWGISDPVPVTEKEESEAVFRGLARGQFFPAPIRFSAYCLTEGFTPLPVPLTGRLTIEGRDTVLPRVKFDLDPLWQFLVHAVSTVGPIDYPLGSHRLDPIIHILRWLDLDGVHQAVTRIAQIIGGWTPRPGQGAAVPSLMAGPVPREHCAWLKLLGGNGLMTVTQVCETLDITRPTFFKYKKQTDLTKACSLRPNEYDCYDVRELRTKLLPRILAGREYDHLRELVTNLCYTYSLRPLELADILP